MVLAGCLAALALAGVGAQGYRLAAEPDDGLAGHILVGMAAVLVLLLAHSWVLFYLLGASRVLREAARDAGRAEALAPPLRALGRRVLPPLLATVAAALATFVLGIGVYGGRAPELLHGALFWATLALQAWAAAAEWRALVACERATAALGAA